MKLHTGVSKYRQALQIARDYGLRIVNSRGSYLVYRICPGRPRDVYLGSRTSVDSLFPFVCRLAGI